MSSTKINWFSRVLLLLGAAALAGVLRFPMWRIDLDAPQYPEGLRLLIYPDKLGGNVDIINGLNHYIGMKTLHTEDFFEFSILPWIIGFFIVAFIATAMIGSRKLVNILFIALLVFGVVAMYDFWRWEYNYGHNLDPNAAIVVPGMAYQPPLIGFKQLLNFGAYSIPDVGGWLFVSAGVLLLLVVLLNFKRKKTGGIQVSSFLLPVLMLTFFSLQSCSSAPVPVKLGSDQCRYCKMTISDPRFSAEIMTDKGKAFVFDDIHCMNGFIKAGSVKKEDIRDYYFSDFSGDHALIESKLSFFLSSGEFHSPMGGNIAAFSNHDSLVAVQQKYPGKVLTIDEVIER